MEKRHCVILLVLVLCIAITGCSKSGSGETEINDYNESNESQTSENRMKSTQVDGELRDELLPLAVHVNEKYHTIANLKTPAYLSIEKYYYIDPNRDLSNDSINGFTSGGEYSDITAYDTIYTPQDAMQDYTSLNVVPIYYHTLTGKNDSLGLHPLSISLEYDDQNDKLSGGQRVIRTYEGFEKEAAEKEWETTLEKGDTYTYDYGKGSAGQYEYYYSVHVQTFDDVSTMYTMYINFKLSDEYIVAFVEKCGSLNKGQGPLGFFMDEATVDVQGYADYLATWIVPAE